jgi:hypothetical protein
MDDSTPRKRRGQRAGSAAALLVAGAVGGGVLAATLSANAANTPAPTNSGSGYAAPGQSGARPNMPAHGGAAHEDAEKPVTGADADKAKAAAIKAAGGGTAGDVTTDFTQRGYEVTVTKTGGSRVEIYLDSSFQAMLGGPGGPGGPQGPPPPGAPLPSASQTG